MEAFIVEHGSYYAIIFVERNDAWERETLPCRWGVF